MDKEFEELSGREILMMSFCFHPAMSPYKFTEKGILLIRDKINGYLSTLSDVSEWPDIFDDFSIDSMVNYLRTVISICDERLLPTGGSTLEVLEMKLENDVANYTFLASMFKETIEILFPERSALAP
jgi:hypothetical protein